MAEGRHFPVFVDNIHPKVKVQDLRNLFGKYGKVKEVTIISSHGFVNFFSADDAVNAIEHLSKGFIFFQKKLYVQASKELDDFLKERQRSFHQRRRSSHEHHRSHHEQHHRQTHRYHEPPRHSHYRYNHRSRSEDHERVYLKRKVQVHPREDLRNVIQQKKPKFEIEENFKIQVNNTEAVSENEEEKLEDLSPKHSEKSFTENEDASCEKSSEVQELHISNLAKQVEKNDLEELLDVHGQVKSVNFIGEGEALVQLECSSQAAQEAVEQLDESHWMDTNIRVKLKTSQSKTFEVWIWSSCLKKDNFLQDMCDKVSDFAYVQEKQWRSEDESVSLKLDCTLAKAIECLQELNQAEYNNHSLRAKFPDNSEDEIQSAGLVENYPRKLLPDSFLPSTSTKVNDKKIKTREIWLWTPAINAKKSFLQDMTPLISQYGKIHDQGWKNEHVYFVLESSEKQAAKCVGEMHGFTYKATQVRAKFADDSMEDNLYKEPGYKILLRNYEKILIPEKKVETKAKSPIKSKSPQLPEMTRPLAKKEKSPPAIQITLNPKPRMISDAMYIESVEGKIYSVSSKLILVGFFVGNKSQRFARIKPGHVFLDGQRNLGYAIKDLRYHDWPDEIKDLFQVGQEIFMDVRRLSAAEEKEMLDLTSEEVLYETTLLWKNSKPMNLVIKQSQPIYKATVIKLWPKWAILQPLVYNGDQTLILMLKEEYHTSENDDIQSLLNHIEIGDTLAVMVKEKPYLDMVEKAQSLDYFKERTNNLKYETVIGWKLETEEDPYLILGKRHLNSDIKNINFVATSSNLNLSLTSEKEASHRKRQGYIEELHKPSGGIIRLTDTMAQTQQWGPDPQRVYFHRSRLYVNGVKMSSHAILEEELSIGDPVTVDVTPNQVDMTTCFISGTEAYWMGLFVKANTSDRGLTIANRLRAEGVDPSVYATRVCQGRVVYLKPPSENVSSVSAGKAVIDSGPNAGQQIEFEAEQCFVYGYSLSRVNLSFIFQTNEPVCIMVKPYNSYILDKLWIGPDIKNNPNDTEGRMQFQKFLFDHGLDQTSFQSLLKGSFPERPFIPLDGQIYKGKIKGLKSDESGHAVTAIIEAEVGELLFLEAPRETIFVYGHWMGKADLRYLLTDEEVCFEYHRVFAKEDAKDGLEPSLVWLGEEASRPKYNGQATSPMINEQMDKDLWTFVGSKQMDVKMFKAMIEGRLPPKEPKETFKKKVITKVETATGETVEVDEDDLATAALLKQIKTQFGKEGLMKAFMKMVKDDPE